MERSLYNGPVTIQNRTKPPRDPHASYKLVLCIDETPCSQFQRLEKVEYHGKKRHKTSKQLSLAYLNVLHRSLNSNEYRGRFWELFCTFLTRSQLFKGWIALSTLYSPGPKSISLFIIFICVCLYLH